MENSVEEVLICCDFSSKHWTPSAPTMSLNSRTVRSTAALFVGRFLDANSALMLVCARPRLVVIPCGAKKYMDMKHLEATVEDTSIAGRLHHARNCKQIGAKLLTLPVRPSIFPSRHPSQWVSYLSRHRVQLFLSVTSSAFLGRSYSFPYAPGTSVSL